MQTKAVRDHESRGSSTCRPNEFSGASESTSRLLHKFVLHCEGWVRHAAEAQVYCLYLDLMAGPIGSQASCTALICTPSILRDLIIALLDRQESDAIAEMDFPPTSRLLEHCHERESRP